MSVAGSSPPSVPFGGKSDRAWGRVPQRREDFLLRRTSGTRAGASGNSALPLPWDLTRPPARGDSLVSLRARPLSRFGRSEVNRGQPLRVGAIFPRRSLYAGDTCFPPRFCLPGRTLVTRVSLHCGAAGGDVPSYWPGKPFPVWTLVYSSSHWRPLRWSVVLLWGWGG